MANIGGFFKKAIPYIATALSFGGPIGTLAGKALSTVAGGQAVGTLDDLANLFVKSPDQQKFITDLKASEQAFQLQLEQLHIQSVNDLEQILTEDRASARQMQVATRSWLPPTLALTVTVGFFGILYYVFVHGVRSEALTIANIMIGMLGTAWTSIIAYYFGSSAGSDRKTELMASNGTK